VGDRGKFRALDLSRREHPNGYFLSVDDDILYPPDYVQRSVEAIDRYERAAVVAYHGGVLPPLVTDYFSERFNGEIPFYKSQQEVSAPTSALSAPTSALSDPTSALSVLQRVHSVCSNERANSSRSLASPLLPTPRSLLSHPAGPRREYSGVWH
jgi:hypothetical protein